jgi:ATP-dependent protease ClpP protease subunit
MRNHLMKLLRDNADKPRNQAIRAEGDVAHVYVYDVISEWWGISALEFAKALQQVTQPTIHLHINSPGGDVFDARAMASTIKQHGARVVALIEGLAASAATTVALAADEVRIADGAMFMIHNAWTITVGNAADHDEQAALLRQVDVAIAADYVRKSGASEEEVRGWMDAETWFSAQECVDKGFADALIGAGEPENRQGWNLSAYRNAPSPEARVAPAPEPQYDRNKYERRLALFERLAS